MTEATLTRELLKVLERKLSGAFIIKHADRFRSGVPDASITWGGTTSWLEVKYVRRDIFREGGSHRLALHKRQFPSAQFVTMDQLAAAGRAIYLIYFGRRIMLWHPRAVLGAIRDGVVILPWERWDKVYPGGFYEDRQAANVADDAELVAFFTWLHKAA
jgi:hypothetical protein